MVELSRHKTSSVVTHACGKPEPTKTPLLANEEVSSSPDSCVLSRPGSSRSSSSHEFEREGHPSRPMDTGTQCESRVSESPNCIVADCEKTTKVTDQSRTEPGQLEGLQKTGMERIKTLIKRRKRERDNISRKEFLDDISEDAWIERELENGIELAAGSLKKPRSIAAVQTPVLMDTLDTQYIVVNKDSCRLIKFFFLCTL